jgi:putative DNA primase/helicase
MAAKENPGGWQAAPGQKRYLESNTMWDIMQAFQSDIVNFGLTPPENITTSQIFRCRAEGKKSGYPGWGIIHMNPDGTAGGCIGMWGGDKQNVFYRNDGGRIGHNDLSPEQRTAFQKQMDEARTRLKAEIAAKQKQAAGTARRIWEKSRPADPGHPYLINKGIEAHGIRQAGQVLIVPLYIAAGSFVSLQRIFPNGSKRHHPGGQVKGCFYSIGDPAKSDIIYICEGFATGASVHQATGQAVFIAFTANNLEAVTGIAKKRHPEKQIIIASDNDIETAKRRPDIGNPGRKAAEAAAAAHGVEMCICPIDSDFNDLHHAHGLEAVKKALEPGESWGDPVLLDSLAVDPLDPTLLIGHLGDMVRAVAAETESPVELAAGLSLAVVATAVQGKIKIRIKPGYFEPLNIWTVTALEPANRKTSVLTKVSRPLSIWEANKRAEVGPKIKDAEIQIQNRDARLKSLRAKYGKAKDADLPEIEKSIKSIESMKIEKPVFPKIWTQDVTPEHLGTLMGSHDQKMSIISSEGGIFDILAGRYSGNIPNLDIFLQGHAGDPVRVDRGSREPVFMDDPCLTMGLSPQPDVLKSLADKPGFRGRGLLARFLYLLPVSNLGYRGLNTDPVQEPVKTSWQNLLFSLLDIEPGTDDYGDPVPHILELSQAAFQEWAEFYQAVEEGLRDGGRFEHIRDWAGKLPGAAARIAGLLHCAENPFHPWEKSLSIETMGRALNLAAYFADHAVVVFGLMGADPAIDEAQKVWKWVDKNRFDSFTRKQCFDALRGTFPRVDLLKEPLKVLHERNYISMEKARIGSARRPSTVCKVNPVFKERWGK